jgi:hypothetical protein
MDIHCQGTRADKAAEECESTDEDLNPYPPHLTIVLIGRLQ